MFDGMNDFQDDLSIKGLIQHDLITESPNSSWQKMQKYIGR